MNFPQELTSMEWWSWLAQIIETIIVLLLAPIAIRQFFLQRKATTDQTVATLNQTIATIISWVQAEEMRQTRHLLYTLEDQRSISRLPAKKWNVKWKQAADRVSQCFNSAAIIALQEPRIHHIWIRPTRRAILKTWTIVQPRIQERRQQEGGLWKEFEWLADTAEKL